jgi:hypothetical protein
VAAWQAAYVRDHEQPSVQFDGYRLAVMGSQLAYLATALGIHVSSMCSSVVVYV